MYAMKLGCHKIDAAMFRKRKLEQPCIALYNHVWYKIEYADAHHDSTHH